MSVQFNETIKVFNNQFKFFNKNSAFNKFYLNGSEQFDHDTSDFGNILFIFFF